MAETKAPQLPRPVTDGPRSMRNYPEQPPVIPPDIEGYEFSLNANRCRTCHKGIPHELPDMSDVEPGWRVPAEPRGDI